MSSENAFAADLSPTAENHYRLLRLAAVFRLIHYLRGLAEASEEDPESCLDPYPFLIEAFEEIRPVLPDELKWDGALQWWEREAERWEADTPDDAPLPFCRLARQAGFSFADRLALVTVGLVEEDIRFGALYAALHDPLPSRRISQGLLESLYGVDSPAIVSRLLETGLVRADNRDAPRAEWVLRVPLPLWDALRGIPLRQAGGLRFRPKQTLLPVEKLILPGEVRRRLSSLPPLLESGQIGGVILRGTADSGHRTVMASLARAMERDVLYWERPASAAAESPPLPLLDEDFTLLGPLCLLTNAFPVLSLDPAPGETIELPCLAGYDGPVGVLLPREGGCGGPLTARALLFTLPSPSREDRRQMWERLVSDSAGTDVETLAARFRLPLSAIAQAAEIARSYAALDYRENILPEDVQQATRALNRQALDLLAQHINLEEATAETAKAAGAKQSGRRQQEDGHNNRFWQRLVVNPATEAELRHLESRCRHREDLRPHLGTAFAASGVNPGVRALFQGPSGTGKTLTAQVLAGLLQMDLYRVDLASIVNKYVGETEKNLSRLLARAEELDVILLIDEGDSLMSGRTEVRSANDRYANLETNYLLQRLETYEGIVFVTTNTGGRIDTAFERRFDAVVRFSLPDARERLRLWQLHLPVSKELPVAFLEEIALTCVLTGGQIRNAALHAALLAASGQRTVTADDVRTAIQREYRKAGVASPLSGEIPATPFDPIAAFLNAAR